MSTKHRNHRKQRNNWRHTGRDKALSLVSAYPNSIIIGCDQTGLCNDQLMHKPGSRTAAIEQLSKMRLRSHFLYGYDGDQNKPDGVALFHDLDTTDLKLRLLSAHEIEAYIDADMPLDCAGSFKIEACITLFSEVKTVDPSALRIFRSS